MTLPLTETVAGVGSVFVQPATNARTTNTPPAHNRGGQNMGNSEGLPRALGHVIEELAQRLVGKHEWDLGTLAARLNIGLETAERGPARAFQLHLVVGALAVPHRGRIAAQDGFATLVIDLQHAERLHQTADPVSNGAGPILQGGRFA